MDSKVIKPMLPGNISSCMYWLDLILNPNQDRGLFRQKNGSLGLIDKKNITSEQWRFFYSITYASLHFTNNNFPTPTSVEEILSQPIFLNQHTKLKFSSDNPYFYCIPLTMF